jgi:hypothetical protein
LIDRNTTVGIIDNIDFKIRINSVDEHANPLTDAVKTKLRETETKFVESENNVHPANENHSEVFDLTAFQAREIDYGHLLLAVEDTSTNLQSTENCIRRSIALCRSCCPLCLESFGLAERSPRNVFRTVYPAFESVENGSFAPGHSMDSKMVNYD